MNDEQKIQILIEAVKRMASDNYCYAKLDARDVDRIGREALVEIGLDISDLKLFDNMSDEELDAQRALKKVCAGGASFETNKAVDMQTENGF